MSRRHRLLGSALTLGLAAFAWYMHAQLSVPLDRIIWFALAYCAFGWLLLRYRGNAPIAGTLGLRRSVWVGLVSFCVGGAALMALATLSLPFIGLSAFESVGSPWFPVILICATVVAYPWVSRNLR
jgi:hypothetical protein